MQRLSSLTRLRQTQQGLSSQMWMRTVQQTDLHCELTGLNVLRGLSGKPEPGCLNTEADSELLSATLKSLTISSMTGISEGAYAAEAAEVAPAL